MSETTGVSSEVHAPCIGLRTSFLVCYSPPESGGGIAFYSMKKISLFLCMSLMVFLCSCEGLGDLGQLGQPDVDDLLSSDITDRLDDLEDRVAKLEKLCGEINTNVSSLKTIVEAVQTRDYVTSVTPVYENGKEAGYRITFARSEAITIWHGKDGADGEDGAPGKDGADGPQGPQGEAGADGKDGASVGSVPEIGIRQDADGVWYWTLNGEWLLDDAGSKVKAVGADGAAGEPGQNGAPGAVGPQGPQGEAGADGITPQLRIENGYWQVSYDEGKTWKELGKAVGEDGKDGLPGEDGKDAAGSLFKDVTWDASKVYFTLSDGTLLTLPKTADSGLDIIFDVEQGFALLPQTPTKVNYTVVGGDDKTLVRSVLIDDKYTFVKQLTSTTGYIIVYDEDYYDYEDKEDVFEDGYFGGGLTYGDVASSNRTFLFSVSDGKGNSILKSLNFVEGKFASVSDAYMADAEASSVQAVVRTNLPSGSYEVCIPETAQSWLSLAATKSLREERITFDVKANGSDMMRSTLVELKNSVGAVMETLLIIQRTENSGEGMVFADKNLEKILVARFDRDADGILTYEEAAQVKSLSLYPDDYDGEFSEESLFSDITITSFDELKHFISLTEIPSGLFYGQSEMTSIVLPEGIISIDYGAFRGCSSLEALVIPEAIKRIGSSAFSGCSSLAEMTIPAGVRWNDSEWTEEYDDGVPSGLFNGCSGLKKVTINTPMNEIPYNFFAGCCSLQEIIYAPGTDISEVGTDAFSGCQALRSFDFSSVTQMGSGAFRGSGIISALLPSSLKEIPYECFQDCSNLTEVELAEGIGLLGESAFRGTGISSVVLPSTVKEIDYACFAYCQNLERVEIKGGVKELRGNLFSECTRLKEVVLPSTVKSIGDYVFSGTLVGAVEVSYNEEGNVLRIVSGEALVLPESMTSFNADCFGYYSDQTCRAVRLTCEEIANIYNDGFYVVYEVPAHQIEYYRAKYPELAEVGMFIPYGDGAGEDTVTGSVSFTHSIKDCNYDQGAMYTWVSMDIETDVPVVEKGALLTYVHPADGLQYTMPIQAQADTLGTPLSAGTVFFDMDIDRYEAYSKDMEISAYAVTEKGDTIVSEKKPFVMYYNQKPDITFRGARIDSTTNYIDSLGVEGVWSDYTYSITASGAAWVDHVHMEFIDAPEGFENLWTDMGVYFDFNYPLDGSGNVHHPLYINDSYYSYFAMTLTNGDVLASSNALAYYVENGMLTRIGIAHYSEGGKSVSKRRAEHGGAAPIRSGSSGRLRLSDAGAAHADYRNAVVLK